MKKLKTYLLSFALLLCLIPTGVFAHEIENEEDISFANPINNGILMSDFNEEKGFRYITIRNDNLLNDSTDILASESGKIVTLGLMPNDKYFVVIQHEDGYLTKYSMLTSLNVNLKDKVSKLDVIGQLTENKIEFVIIKDGERLTNTSKILGFK